MASNPATFLRKTPLFFRIACSSGKPNPHFKTSLTSPRNQLCIVSGFKSCSHSSSSLSCGFKELHHPTKIGFGRLGSESFRFFSVSNGGSGGGNNGYGGGSGGGNSGNNGGGVGDGDGNKWSFLSWYLSLLENYPVWTKAFTSALLTFIGDLTCQIAVDQVPSLDWKRTFTFTFLGLVLVAPVLHYWYWYLSKLVTSPGASGAFLRLLLDQFLFAPIFIGTFLSTLVTLEGRPSEVIPKLQQEWFSSVVANWQLWIPFQFLNFRFVPQQFQVLAANFISLIWNVILSYKAHKEVLAK